MAGQRDCLGQALRPADPHDRRGDTALTLPVASRRVKKGDGAIEDRARDGQRLLFARRMGEDSRVAAQLGRTDTERGTMRPVGPSG